MFVWPTPPGRTALPEQRAYNIKVLCDDAPTSAQRYTTCRSVPEAELNTLPARPHVYLIAQAHGREMHSNGSNVCKHPYGLQVCRQRCAATQAMKRSDATQSVEIQLL